MAASTVAQLITGVTPVLDTNAYASGDVLFQAVKIENAAFAPGRCVELIDIHCQDKDAQGIAHDLIFFQNQLASLGTINDVCSATDAQLAAAGILGWVSVVAGDFTSLVTSKIMRCPADLKGNPRMFECAGGSRDIWVAGVARGTPTHTAAGLVYSFGFRRH